MTKHLPSGRARPVRPGPGEAQQPPDVHSITDARVPHTAEMRGRVIRYSVSMGLRMVCLLLVFVVDGWLQWFFIAGAVFLPYFAVIIANGGSDTNSLGHSASLLDQAPAPQLEAYSAPAAPAPSGFEVIPGEVVDGNGTGHAGNPSKFGNPSNLSNGGKEDG